MFARLRALERKLVRERTELAITEQADKLAGEWTDALDCDRPVPDALDFVHRIVRAGYRLTTFSSAIGYLDRCLGNRSPPESWRPGPETLALVPPHRLRRPVWVTYNVTKWHRKSTEYR